MASRCGVLPRSSPESRRRRFFTPTEPTEALVQRLADAHDPGRALTLIVDRYVSEDETMPRPPSAFGRLPPPRICPSAIGWPKWPLRSTTTFRARGSRRAARAAGGHRGRHGFEWFQACTLNENTPMLDVFRDSGFEVRSKSRAARSICSCRSRRPRKACAPRRSATAPPPPRRCARCSHRRPSRSSAPRATRRASDAGSSTRCHRGLQGPDLSGQSERRRNGRPRLLPLGPRPAGRRGSRGRGGAEPRLSSTWSTIAPLPA